MCLVLQSFRTRNRKRITIITRVNDNEKLFRRNCGVCFGVFEEGEEELDSEHGNIYLGIYRMTDKNGEYI